MYKVTIEVWKPRRWGEGRVKVTHTSLHRTLSGARSWAKDHRNWLAHRGYRVSTAIEEVPDEQSD